MAAGLLLVLDGALVVLEGALVVVGTTVGTTVGTLVLGMLRLGTLVVGTTTGVQVEEMTEEVAEGMATSWTGRLVGALIALAVW